MNSWDKNRKEAMYKQKLQKVKSTMHKSNSNTAKKKTINSVNINSPQTQAHNKIKSPLSTLGTSYNSNILLVQSPVGINSPYNYIDQLCIQSSNNDFDINTQITRQENFQKQKNLKRFLKEFGLQQYLRKFYELGYDDTNIHKLSKIPYKDYEEFLILVKAFPGHKVKIISFIEYIKKVFSAPYNNVKSNQISNNTKTSFYVTNNFPKTSQSAATKRFPSVNTNRVSNSKLPAKPKSVETLRSKNKILRSLANTNGNNYGFGFDYYLSENENNKNEMRNLDELDNETKSKDEQSNNINKKIDKMLNFYMSKLNEDIEDSYESIDDEIIHLSNFQSNCVDEAVYDINNHGDVQNKKINISVIKIKDEAEDTPISDVKTQIDMIDKSGGGVDIKEELKNVREAKSKKFPTDDFDIDYSNLLDQSSDDEKGEPANEEIIFINHKHNIEEKSNQMISEPITTELKKENYVNQISSRDHNYDYNEQSLPIIKEKGRLTKSSDNNTDTEEITDPYGHIRLTKSCEKEYIREDMENFDIEYMCRCLGLALMKHLESGQDKGHIMDLIDFSQNFSFFNSLFNSNMDFFFTFFNMENQDKLSNLDKLTLDEYSQSKPNKANTDVIPENDNNSKPISFFSHIQPNKARESMIKEEEVEDKSLTKKENLKYLKNNTVHPIQKDMNTINEFFKTQTVSNYNHILNDRYKNINEKTKIILNQDLNPINELDSLEYCKKNMLLTVEHQKDFPLKSKDVNYANLLKKSAAEFIGIENGEEENILSNENETNLLPPSENRFSNYNYADNLSEDLDRIKKDADVGNNNPETEDIDDYYYKDTPLHKIQEEIFEKEDLEFESGLIESNYIFDVTNAEKLKTFLLRTVEVFDDDYNYSQSKVMHKRYAPMPDPNQIFEFCTNVILTTKMEKEVIIICLIYIERFIFNTGILINSRNWRRLLFTSLIIASKIWDDDSFENNHFSQVFTHLSIGEINMMERSFLELINYKVYVKCSEYFKYFFIIKSIALKYNFDGLNLVPISVERMMVLQEYAYQMQKKLRRKYSYSNSAQF